MAEKDKASTAEESSVKNVTEDPEEVAAKEAGNQTPAPAPAEDETSDSSTDDDEVNSDVHEPHTVEKREV